MVAHCAILSVAIHVITATITDAVTDTNVLPMFLQIVHLPRCHNAGPLHNGHCRALIEWFVAYGMLD